MFTSQAVAIIYGLIREHLNRSGSEMADLTHGIAWKVAEPNEAIPYESSIISDEEITQEGLSRIEQLVQQYGIKPE